MKTYCVSVDDETAAVLELVAAKMHTDVETYLASVAKRYRRPPSPVQTRVLYRVLNGMCDADIATELDMTKTYVSGIRQAFGFRANPRFTKAAR